MRCFLLLFTALLVSGIARAAEPDPGAVTLEPGFKIQTLFENDETCTKDATFSVKRARATLDGALSDRLTAHMTIETIDNDDGIVLLQGYATYTFHRALNIQAGQIYVPFGIENRRGFDKREFFDRSFVTDQVLRNVGRKQGDRDARFRDIGAAVHGKITFEDDFSLDYAAMAFNGNGILATDNNDEKDLSARIVIGSPWRLSLSGSAYTGTWLNEMDTTEFDEQAFGIGAQWLGKIAGRDIRAQAEYLWANYETAAADIEPTGLYLYAAAFILPQLETGIRYDRFEPDTNDSRNINWQRISLTARYHLAHGSLIAADYEIREKDSEDIDNRLIVQLLAVF